MGDKGKSCAADVFECGICLQRYNLDGRRPKVLPCGHTNCLTCLTDQVLRGNFLCSMCRKVFPGDVKSLTDNFLLCPYLERGTDMTADMRFFCTSCQCEAKDICIAQHSIRSMTSVVLEQVQEAKTAAKKQFKKEEELLNEFLKMLQSTKDSVEKTLTKRIEKESEEYQSRCKEVQHVSKVIDEVPGTAFQGSDGVTDIVDDFLTENSLRVFFYEEQKRMLEVAKKCTLTVTSEDSQVSWDFKVSASKKGAPEEKVLAYLLYVMLVNQNQRREEVMRQQMSQPSKARSSAVGVSPAGGFAGSNPSAPCPSGKGESGDSDGTWQRASWAATPWPENSNSSRLETLLDKVKRCVVEGVSMNQDNDDDSDSDGFSFISEASVPEQIRRTSKRLFVDGLPHNISQQELKEVFANHGKVSFVRILDSKKRKRSTFSCALVYFSDKDSLENILRNRPYAFQRKGEWKRIPLKVVEDRRIQKREAKAARKDFKNRRAAAKCSQNVNVGDGEHYEDGLKVYLGNVPLDVTEPELMAFFSHYGNVKEASIRPHGVGKKNFGFAFIIFTEKEAVQRVLDAKPYFKGIDLQVREFKSNKNSTTPGNSGPPSKGKKVEAVSSGPASAQAAFSQVAMNALAASAASLQLQASASFQAAAAALNNHSQGLYPSLNIPVETVKAYPTAPAKQGKVNQQANASKQKQNQNQKPQQGGGKQAAAAASSGLGMSYEDVVQSSSARQQQGKKAQAPSAGGKRAKGSKDDDACCVM